MVENCRVGIVAKWRNMWAFILFQPMPAEQGEQRLSACILDKLKGRTLHKLTSAVEPDPCEESRVLKQSTETLHGLVTRPARHWFHTSWKKKIHNCQKLLFHSVWWAVQWMKTLHTLHKQPSQFLRRKAAKVRWVCVCSAPLRHSSSTVWVPTTQNVKVRPTSVIFGPPVQSTRKPTVPRSQFWDKVAPPIPSDFESIQHIICINITQECLRSPSALDLVCEVKSG